MLNMAVIQFGGDTLKQILFIGLVIVGYIVLLLVEGLVYGTIAELIGRKVQECINTLRAKA